MTRKRTLAAAITIVGALALAACSSDAAGGGGGSSDGKTLSVTTVTTEKAPMEAVEAAYKKAHPDVTFKNTFSGVDVYQPTVRTQLSSGTSADVLFVWPGDGNPVAMKVVAKAGYLQDFSDKSWAKDIPTGVQSVTQEDGKTWIAPVTFSGIGSIYNTNAMTAAGLTAPTTFSDLLTFCSAAKAKGKVAIALGAQTNWNTQLIPYALAPTLVYGPQPDFAQQMTDGKVTFADSKWVDVFDEYTQMQKSGCFQDDVLGTSYESAITMVAKGDAMSMVSVNATEPAILAEASPDTKLDLQPLPATDDASATRMAGALGASYGISAKTKNKTLANSFIDFLETPEGINTYCTAAAAIPAIPNDEFTIDPSLQALKQYQADGKTDPFMDQLWPNARVQQVHFAQLQDLLGGKTTSVDALKQMDAAYAQGA